MTDAPLTSDNPKAEAGVLKASLSYVPTGVLMELAIGMMEGGFKYGRHNYRAEGMRIRSSIYFDAVIRHLFAWWEGEDIDPESGMHHVAKAMTTLAVLRDSQMTGAFLDDRPPKLPADWLADLNKRAAELNAKYPEKRAVTTAVPQT